MNKFKQKAVAFPTTDRARSIYNNIPSERGVTTTPSYLRLESAALGTQSSINFNLLRNEGGAANETEQRLALTDSFVATEIGIFLLKVTTAGTNRGDTLRTFPNSLLFSGSGEAANLMNIYNGKLGITINGQVIIDSWDVMRHYRVGNAQKSVLTAASGTGNAWDQNTFDSASYGMYPLTPQVILSGAAKNTITINCPASVNMIGTSSTNYCVVIFRGFLKQNGSNL